MIITREVIINPKKRNNLSKVVIEGTNINGEMDLGEQELKKLNLETIDDITDRPIVFRFSPKTIKSECYTISKNGNKNHTFLWKNLGRNDLFIRKILGETERHYIVPSAKDVMYEKFYMELETAWIRWGDFPKPYFHFDILLDKGEYSQLIKLKPESVMKMNYELKR